ncbi:MAG: hypothetical protein KGL52_00615, partial [Rhodospirillales bacterium]|nr:hypothetical protein [Rhodospirillales bacterium]
MNSELQFRDLISALMRRRGMVLCVALGGTVLILLAAMLIPARYTATAEIVLALQSDGHAGTPQLNEQLILTKVTELKSDALLRRAADALTRDPRFQAAESGGPVAARTAGDLVRRTLYELLPAWVLPGRGVRACRRLRVAALRRHLKVAQEAGSHVIGVHYTSTDPELAALVANRITALYMKSQTEERQADAGRTLAWLRKRIPATKTHLSALEAEIRAYRGAHGFAAVTPGAVTSQEFADLNGRLIGAESRLAADRARLAGLRTRRGAAGAANTLDTPALDALRARETELAQAEASLGVTMGPNNPLMQQTRSAMRAVRSKVGQEIAREEAGLRAAIRVQAAQVQMLRHNLGRIQDVSGDVWLDDLMRRASSDRQHYEDLLQRRQAAVEQLQTVSSGFDLLSWAVPPERPSTPNPLLFGPPALIFLLACGSLAAVAMDRLDGTMRSEADVTEALGIPCIGLLPRLRRVRRLRPHQSLLRDDYGPYVEAVRSIAATSLLAAGNRPQFVLVTSSVPGEGKTTLAVSFATYAARLGKRTILLDLDFRHPATAREFGPVADTATLARLLDKRPVGETVQRLPMLHLDYVPMGGIADPLQLFANNQIAELLETLRES